MFTSHLDGKSFASVDKILCQFYTNLLCAINVFVKFTIIERKTETFKSSKFNRCQVSGSQHTIIHKYKADSVMDLRMWVCTSKYKTFHLKIWRKREY